MSSYPYTYGYDSSHTGDPRYAQPRSDLTCHSPEQPQESEPSPPVMATQFITPNNERQYPTFPPSLYFADSGTSSASLPYVQTPAPHMHYYPPPLRSDLPQPTPTDRPRPPLTLNLPPPSPFMDPTMQMPMGYVPNPTSMGGQQTGSPYLTPFGMPSTGSESGHSGQGLNEYFPPFGSIPSNGAQPVPEVSPTWSSQLPGEGQRPKGKRDGGQGGAKTSRQQFTACGACRHRRVKCDLKDRQEEAERQALEQESHGVGPHRSSTAASAAARRKKVSCTNCQERGTNCV